MYTHTNAHMHGFLPFSCNPTELQPEGEKTNQINSAVLILPRHGVAIWILLEIIYLPVACGIYLKLNT